jgi:histone deacetylase HOS3
MVGEYYQQQRETKAAVYIQDACLQHRYIRSKDRSEVVERPERLRAVKLGLATAIARLEEIAPAGDTHLAATPGNEEDVNEGDDKLVASIARLNLASDSPKSTNLLIPVIQSSASVDISIHPAVKFVHEGDYLEKLVKLARESHDKIAKGGSEIPNDLSQTDLYRALLLIWPLAVPFIVYSLPGVDRCYTRSDRQCLPSC